MNRLVKFAGALSAVLACQLVSASSPVMTGSFAGADSADTVANNPAGMSRLAEGAHREVELITFLSFDEFKVDESKTTRDGGNPDKEMSPQAIPAFYYVNSINEDWRYGFTVNIPSGFGSTNGDSWAGRYYSDDFSLVYISISPALSYRVNEHLSVGGAINFNYNTSTTKTAVNNDILDPGTPDGKFEYSAGAFGIAATISMLYEFDSQTRLGLVYVGESKADLNDTVHLRNLGPNTDELLTVTGVKNSRLKVTNVMPQRVQLGLYHELDDGQFFTVDTLWIDFSSFGTGEVSLGEFQVTEPKGIYQDMWALALGYGFPANEKMTYKFGLAYLSSGVSNEKRTLSMRLDEMFAAGAGFTRQLQNNKAIDVNFNVVNTGRSPVDTGHSLTKGRVVGESNSPWIIALDLAYHW
jgi:long-chain fatty acid transport protein